MENTTQVRNWKAFHDAEIQEGKNDFMSAAILDIANMIVKSMEAEHAELLTAFDAAKTKADKHYNPSGSMMAVAVGLVLNQWERGEELRAVIKAVEDARILAKIKRDQEIITTSE